MGRGSHLGGLDAAFLLVAAAALTNAPADLWATPREAADRAVCDSVVDATSDVDRAETGGELRFALTVVADCDHSSVVLTDTLPFVVDREGRAYPAFTVIAVDPPADRADDNEIAWDLGPIPAGGSTTVTLTVAFDEPLAAGHQIVNAACLTAAELEGSRCDSAVVAVGEAGPEPNGTPGFWCRQLLASREEPVVGDVVPADELAALLIEANNASLVFTALYDTSSVELVAPLLCRPESLTGTADRMARQLIALWLSVVSYRVGEQWRLGDLCPGGEEAPEGTAAEWTVGDVLDHAEAALLYGATDRDLRFWTRVTEFASHAHPPQSCSESRRPGGPASHSP